MIEFQRLDLADISIPKVTGGIPNFRHFPARRARVYVVRHRASEVSESKECVYRLCADWRWRRFRLSKLMALFGARGGGEGLCR